MYDHARLFARLLQVSATDPVRVASRGVAAAGRASAYVDAGRPRAHRIELLRVARASPRLGVVPPAAGPVPSCRSRRSPPRRASARRVSSIASCAGRAGVHRPNADRSASTPRRSARRCARSPRAAAPRPCAGLVRRSTFWPVRQRSTGSILRRPMPHSKSIAASSRPRRPAPRRDLGAAHQQQEERCRTRRGSLW